ncbi:MAG: tRNA epoxyqueuosine(34) reductase QueG [Acidobacteria bacterium]|nr:tRNA epoxyqueuosine(34) reductase QueG [Acidobacteriota bacterium]
MMIEQLTATVKEQARRLGFNAVGVIRVEPLTDEERCYLKWIEDGMSADMAYLQCQPTLRARPNELAPTARSIISLAVNYYSGEFDPLKPGEGRIARYAWGLDYHEVIPPTLWALVASIENLVGRKVKARCFVDAVPLLERAVARRAGLGRIGFNSCLITDRFGSWVFLSDILLDVELAPDEEDARTCLSTFDCIINCPTGAIPEPYVVDARRCISYQTIENRGIIPRHMRPLMGDWLFGCDVCQEVCPHNRVLLKTTWKEFYPESGVGKTLSIHEVLSIHSDEIFRHRFRHTALLRTKRRGLVRNATIVAANTKHEPAIPLLKNLIESDPDPIIRGHAVWALGQFSGGQFATVLEQALKDEDPFVRQEAQAAMGILC